MSEQRMAEQRGTLKTLACIEHMLRIYWSPEPFKADPPALEWLLDNGLIYAHESWFKATERGMVYVEAIRELPLPVQKWAMP
jgi:hypothetical protein